MASNANVLLTLFSPNSAGATAAWPTLVYMQSGKPLVSNS